ncbi:unnamed protein product [Clavelina lepadiformis]|uniref:Ribosomal protein S11 n=1 Tax=Clavelina lepadiformis TaxID=159417 RepID=A0ABP0H0K8_CLALP
MLTKLAAGILQRCTVLYSDGCLAALQNGSIQVTLNSALHTVSGARKLSSSTPKKDQVILNLVDKQHESVKNQNFGPILLNESDVSEGHTAKSSFEYAKREDLVFNGIPYKKLPIVKVNARWNNTLITVRDADDPEMMYSNLSCRKVGYFNASKKTELAGETTGAAAATKALERGCPDHVRVKIYGIGPGRRPSIRGLVLGGFKVVSITDVTPITNEGLSQRPRKIRRI